MHSRKFEGMWEDVSQRHAQALQGHRVEIRVLDSVKGLEESWSEFQAKVAVISRGKRIPGGRMYKAEDFYDSRD